jgi:hypothetical protein
MTLGQTQLGIVRRPRWRGTVVHGSVLAALLAGALAFWSTLALVAALLASPVETMATFQRKGAWGLPDVLRQGTMVLVSPTQPPTSGGRR